MKQKLLTSFSILFFAFISTTQEKVVIYNPQADANKELKSSIAKAEKEGKHVFIQIGGNWCPWCIEFHKFCKKDNTIDSLFKADYIVLRINYSPDNKNEDILKKLDYPQRFGFPVFVILHSTGKRIHTQNSGLLEKDKSYSEKKIIRFLKNWNKAAIDPSSYKKL